MKQIFLALLVVCLLVPLVAQAQPTTRKVYADSIVYAATPSEASNLAWLTLGYGKSINLKSDVGAYKDKMLHVTFIKKTDSIRVYGGSVNFGTDTSWVVLPLPVLELKRLAAINTAAGSKVVRDTMVTWLSPVTTDLMDFTVDMSAYYFTAYKVRLGVFDSGKVYIQDIRRGGY